MVLTILFVDSIDSEQFGAWFLDYCIDLEFFYH